VGLAVGLIEGGFLGLSVGKAVGGILLHVGLSEGLLLGLAEEKLQLFCQLDYIIDSKKHSKISNSNCKSDAGNID
jgi:hypothetical protein